MIYLIYRLRDKKKARVSHGPLIRVAHATLWLPVVNLQMHLCLHTAG